MGSVSEASHPRVAMVGMASENCTFSQARTTLADFEVLRGEDLRKKRYPFLSEDGFGGVVFLPLVHARALPGGMITEETYSQIEETLLGALQEVLPVEAVYLDLHGAMHVEGRQDAEADLVAAIRERVGSDCLLGASMDLHGNVSASLVAQVDLFSAYRTAPHIDEEATRAKGCRMLAESLREGWTLERAWVPIPVLLPGEMTSTLDEPGASLYAGLAEFDDLPGLLDVSLWVGYVWADTPRAHGAVVVTAREGSETDPAAIAETVAQRYWDAREAFRFNVPAGPLSKVLEKAIGESVKPVVVSDSGDNPTAGGVGNLPFALRAVAGRSVYRDGQKHALIVGIWDPEAVAQCTAAGVDAEILLVIGRHVDGRHSKPFEARVTVKHFFDHDPVAGRQVVIQIGKGIHAVLTERRKPFHHFPDFHVLGLKPEEMDLVVVKIGYLVTDLQKLAAKAFLALTPGAVNQHVTEVAYHEIERPMFPFERDFEWHPRAVRFGIDS